MIFEKVAAILAKQLDVEEESITPETNLVDDLGADSLDVVDLVMTLEDEFDMEIPDEDVENVRTVGDIVKYLEDRSFRDGAFVCSGEEESLDFYPFSDYNANR